MRRAAILVWCLAVPLGLFAEAASYGRSSPVEWLADLLAGWACFGFGGLVVWRRRSVGIGWLLVATGVCWFLPNLMLAGPDGLAGFTAYVLLLHRGPLIHLLLTYPGSRPARWAIPIVLLGYASAIAFPVWQHLVPASLAALAVTSAAAYGHRRSLGPLRASRRRALVATVVFASVVIAEELLRFAAPTIGGPPLLMPYEVALAAIAGWLAVRLVVSGTGAELTDLVIELGERRAGSLRTQLARVLGDPRLQVGYRLAESGAYIDAQGRPIALPGPGDARRVTPIEREGTPVAVLIHDPAILGDPQLVRAVATATSLSSAHARLQAELRGQLAEISASRLRLLRAGDDERVRLEERLQAGAGKRLGVLAEELQVARRQVTPETAEQLDRADRQLERVLDDLRRLAAGIHPREVAERGLPYALLDLAHRAPLPVRVSVADAVAELPLEVAVGIFYVCAEGLSNAVKYAAGTVVSISVSLAEEAVTAELVDDGIGGARIDAGSGLRGLADRIEALGGTLTVASPPGRGTRLFATIPSGASA